MSGSHVYVDHWSARTLHWLFYFSIALLRISLGVNFLGMGVLKFVPGLSPAEDLAADTMRVLKLGLLPPEIGLALVATLETVIGELLISGHYLPPGPGLLAVEMIAPLVFFLDRLFAVPTHALTLEGG